MNEAVPLYVSDLSDWFFLERDTFFRVMCYSNLHSILESTCVHLKVFSLQACFSHTLTRLFAKAFSKMHVLVINKCTL